MKVMHCALPPGYVDEKMHPNTIKNVSKWKSLNEDTQIKQKIYNYEECCSLIEENFDDELLLYFKTQPHGHFKSDLWRLCALYIYGGVYADIDQELLVPFSSFFDEEIDFCGVANMERYNLSNGFIYAKKQNKIIEKNIELTYKKYRYAITNNLLGDVKFIGGCYIMGEVISEMISSKEMPIGEIEIEGVRCKFLHEVGDKQLESTNKQSFWNSFSVFDGKNKIMNSRYETYYMDKNKKNEFIKAVL